MALVTPETKLCDVIIDEPSVIPVINRFDIELGVGDKTIKTICSEKSIDLNFFLLILNAF
ncbi:MAG TPA: helix-turn-helix transcriptional regulator, partial [Candidatus Limisoma intestinavium]|nr:helix-turn-helix transcriptional regulator [Candidatus Limisoma intestinavium]